MKLHRTSLLLPFVLLLAACNLPSGTQPPPVTSFPGLPAGAPPPTVSSPSIIDQYLSRPHVAAFDPLNTLDNWNFNPGTGTLQNGVFQLVGSPGWHSSFWPKQQFKEGQGLVVRFQVHRANARSEFVLVTGDWMTDTFRQFGLYNSVIPRGDLFQGRQDLGGYPVMGSLRLQSMMWYNLLLAIGRGGRFLAVVWDPNNPSLRAFYEVKGGPAWLGRSWVFLPKVNTGETVFVDYVYRLTFQDIK